MDRIEKKVQNFVVGNRMHALSVNLYGVLAELFRHMTDEGSAPYKRFILCNLDKMGKENHWFDLLTTKLFLMFCVQSSNLLMQLDDWIISWLVLKLVELLNAFAHLVYLVVNNNIGRERS